MFSFTRSWSRSRLRIKIPGDGAAPKQAGSETLDIVNIIHHLLRPWIRIRIPNPEDSCIRIQFRIWIRITEKNVLSGCVMSLGFALVLHQTAGSCSVLKYCSCTKFALYSRPRPP